MVQADPPLDRVVRVIVREHNRPWPRQVTRDSPAEREYDIYGLDQRGVGGFLDKQTFFCMDYKEESKHQVDSDNLERLSNDISELHQSSTVRRSFVMLLIICELMLENIKIHI